MNDKLQDLLDGIQRTAVQATDAVTDAASGVSRKANELLSTAKLNIRSCELKSDVNEGFRQLGEMLYATHTGNPTDSADLLAKLEEIDGIKAQLSAIQAQLNRAAAVPQDPVCTVCGSAAKAGDQFCRECGSPLKQAAPAQETPAAPVTPVSEAPTEQNSDIPSDEDFDD